MFEKKYWNSVRHRSLDSLDDVSHILAILLHAWAIIGYMSQRDYCHSLEIIRREKFAHDVSVVIAHPASAKSALRSSQTYMLCGNRHVYVTMLFVVFASSPAFCIVFHAYDIERCRLKPFPVVSLPKAFPCLFICMYLSAFFRCWDYFVFYAIRFREPVLPILPCCLVCQR